MSDRTKDEKSILPRGGGLHSATGVQACSSNVFHLAVCDYQMLWEDTVAYKYSHAALAEDKAISHKESPQKYSTWAHFCNSNSSLLLASVELCEILKGKTVRRWMYLWICSLQ